MSSDKALGIIFTINITLSAIFKFTLKSQVVVSVTLGVGALLLMGVSLLIGDTSVPAWMLGVSGIVILVDVWLRGKKSR